jgi:hypothetical protein
MKYQAKVKFPCGMEYEAEMQTGLIMMGFGKIESELAKTICPLHGKGCSRKR